MMGEEREGEDGEEGEEGVEEIFILLVYSSKLMWRSTSTPFHKI